MRFVLQNLIALNMTKNSVGVGTVCAKEKYGTFRLTIFIFCNAIKIFVNTGKCNQPARKKGKNLGS